MAERCDSKEEVASSTSGTNFASSDGRQAPAEQPSNLHSDIAKRVKELEQLMSSMQMSPPRTRRLHSSSLSNVSARSTLCRWTRMAARRASAATRPARNTEPATATLRHRRPCLLASLPAEAFFTHSLAGRASLPALSPPPLTHSPRRAVSARHQVHRRREQPPRLDAERERSELGPRAVRQLLR